MPKNHLFIMDPLNHLNLELDTSLRMAQSLSHKGHNVYAAFSQGIFWDSREKGVCCQVSKIIFGQTIESTSLELIAESKSFSDFDCIHMRKDPPFDIGYLSTTWLLNGSHSKVGPIVLNSPEGIRAINEKLAILRYPEFIQPALVSCQPDQIYEFIRDVCGGDAVVKPLNLYGGKGISRVQLAEKRWHTSDSVINYLQLLTGNAKEWRLVQPFDPGIFAGEVRAFCVAGKPLAWCLKKPVSGQFMANSNFNSTRHTYRPSDEEVECVTKVAVDLLKSGIFVVGFDLISGRISEINVTSPRLLFAPTEDSSIYFREFADRIDQRLQQ